MRFIGIDIGTTSICGILMDAASGKIIQSLTKENKSHVPSKQPWEFIQNPDIVVSTVHEIVSILSRDEQISGIGLTGQMHGILYVNDSGNHISPLYTWQDQRGDLPLDEAHTYVEYLSNQTKYPLSTGFGLVTHFYNVQHELVPQEAYALCTIGDYAAMRLCGRNVPLMDATNAASIGLFKLETLQFDIDALKEAGIDSRVLPQVVPSGTVIGSTKEGVPVVSALGDNQASFLGSVRNIGESLLLNVGTGSQISVYSEQLMRIEPLDTRPFPGRGVLLVGASLSGGKSYALLEQFFREVILVFGEVDRGSLYERMNELIESVYDKPGEARLSVNTQFFGTRKNPLKKGSIEGITPLNFTPAHMIEGFLQGMLSELYEFYEMFPEAIKAQLTAMVGSGNGIRKNLGLRRMISDQFGLPLQFPPYQEEASYGAAICAAVGCGYFPDFFHIEFSAEGIRE